MIVDLFAGPGGWSEGLRSLGLDEVGVEVDPWACSTRRAAGHPTVEADVTTLDPGDYAGAAGLIASPPCQLYSQAGKGYGRDAVPILEDAIARCAHGNDTRAATRDKVADLIESAIADDYPADGWLPLPGVPTPARAAADELAANAVLVLEPAWWAHVIRPEWIALEQVPAVLPLWHALAGALSTLGYSAESGILNAADYGVPQTRRRAILVAHRDRPATLPPATHAKGGADGLAPWVTMADALGWTGKAGDPDGATPTHLDRRAMYVDGVPTVPLIPVTASAPTLTCGLLASGVGRWAYERPATTVAGDPRIWPPGHKVNADDIARLGEDEARARYGDRAGTDALAITPAEALALQGFPPDYPVQGGRSAVFEQIGNAVPPPLAAAIVAHLTT